MGSPNQMDWGGLTLLVNDIQTGVAKPGQTGSSVTPAVIALSATSPVSVSPVNSTDNTYTLTPTSAWTVNAATVPAGAIFRLVITTSGTTAYTITFGTNFKSTGTLSTGTTSGKVFVISFISDGVNFNEVSRTTAM